MLRSLLLDMAANLDVDKRLARHLFPGLMELCKELGIEIHGSAFVAVSKRH